MQTTLSTRPRRAGRPTSDRRRLSVGLGSGVLTHRSASSFTAPTPRCLGELRLADLLAAGLISVAEFERERAALVARL
jgi:hypothetical protein